MLNTWMDTNAGIYRIRNLTNGKCYIGQTSNLKTRRSQHWSTLRTGHHANPRLQAAWNKHGEASFVFETICHCPAEQLHHEEQKALAALPLSSRYNIGPAGYSPTLGIEWSTDRRVRSSRDRGGRPFFAKHLKTGKVRRFEHTGEAEEVGFQQSHIWSCLQGLRSTHKGHQFYYDHDSPPVLKADKRHRAVIGTAIADGKELQFPYTSAVTSAGFSHSSVQKCLAGKIKTHKGYTWRYADGLPHRTLDATRQARLVGMTTGRGSRPVEASQGEQRLVFAGLAEAARHFAVSPTSIWCAITGRTKRCRGYTWRYLSQ